MKKIIHTTLSLLIVMLWLFLSTKAQANHSSGLHLQLSESLTVDILSRDISEFHVLKISQDRASVMLLLSPDAANKINCLTQQSVGTSVAWIWNGRVLYVETLKAPLSRDITLHNLTAHEAENFQKAITH